MIVLLFGVMAGLAWLARGVLFTVAACLVLAASVAVLYVSLRVVGALVGQTWLQGALAILAFVLAIGGPAYLLAVREPSTRREAVSGDPPGADQPAGDDPTVERPTDDDPTAEQPAGDPRTDDDPADDGTAGASDPGADEGRTTARRPPDDPGDVSDGDDEAPGAPGG